MEIQFFTFIKTHLQMKLILLITFIYFLNISHSNGFKYQGQDSRVTIDTSFKKKITGEIDRTDVKQINKLIKKFAKSSSQSEIEISLKSIEDYFSESDTRFYNVSFFVLESDYLIRKIQLLKGLQSQQYEAIKRLKVTLNQKFNFFNIKSFELSIDSISELSEKWKQYLEFEELTWIQPLTDLYIFREVLIKPIKKQYFKKLLLSQTPADQKNIEIDFFTKFPRINENRYSSEGESENPIDFIIGIEEDSSTGVLTIFDHSYIHYFSQMIGEFSLLKNISYWISGNETGADLKTNVDKEIFSLRNGHLIEKIEAYKNNLLFYQIFFPEDDIFSHPELMTVFDNGIKKREIHFIFPNKSERTHSTYTFYFDGTQNITLSGKEDTILTSKVLINDRNFSEALRLLGNARNNNLPAALAINKSLDAQYANCIQRRNEFEESKIKATILKVDSLNIKENFDEAKRLIKEAQNNFLPATSVSNLQLNQKFIDTENQKNEVFIRNEKNRLNNLINQGQNFINSSKYDAAIALFENELFLSEKDRGRKTNPNQVDQHFKNQVDIIKSKLETAKSLKKAEQDRILAEAIKTKNRELEEKLNFTKIGKVEISKNYLNVTTFTNGEKLEFAATPEEFAEKTLDRLPVYCYYNFDNKFSAKGYYYNLFAFNDLKGRKLFPDEYRLPFNSELNYMRGVINQIESKNPYNNRLILKDYLYNSNSDKTYNGYNFVVYERNTFNGAVTNEQLKKGYDGFGKYGFIDEIDELKHIFWTLNDFSESNYVSEEGVFNTNFKGQDYSHYVNEILENPINYGICKFNRDNNSYEADKLLISSYLNIEKIMPRVGHKGDYELFAVQIKLVKQRTEIRASDWLPNSTSMKLKYTHIINKYDKNKKEFTTIQVANNLSEWLDFCNKEIPACMSFEFNPKNDKTHGLLYNQAVFLSNSQNGLNHPVVENSKMIDLIDLSNLRYSYNGSPEEFYDFLMQTHGLRYGGSCSYDDEKKELIFTDYSNPGTYSYGRLSPKSSFFPVLPSRRDNYSEKSYLLTNFSSNSFNERFNISFNFSDPNANSNYKNYYGYSIRFLKNK